MTPDLLIAIAMLCAEAKHRANCQIELIICAETETAGVFVVSSADRVAKCVQKGVTR